MIIVQYINLFSSSPIFYLLNFTYSNTATGRDKTCFCSFNSLLEEAIYGEIWLENREVILSCSNNLFEYNTHLWQQIKEAFLQVEELTYTPAQSRYFECKNK